MPATQALGGKTGSRLGSRAAKVVSKKVCNTNVVGSKCITLGGK